MPYKSQVDKNNANKLYNFENRDRLLEYKREWNRANRVKRAAYMANARATDLQCRLADNLRSRVRTAMKNQSKFGSAVRDLDCTMHEFIQHIQNQFTNGMSWDNYGLWHLDHIKPLASFDLTQKDQFLVATHYSNYQPLWAADNYAKGSKTLTDAHSI